MYATADDLDDWLEGGDYTPPADPTRILVRAWEVIADHTFGAYEVDSVTLLATDPGVVTAFTRAQCAQVESWLEVGEESDIAGYPVGTSVSAGGLSVSQLPDTLAPRAARILRGAGLAVTSPGGVRLI